MENKNFIGLCSQKSLEVSNKLNNLLADYQIFYQNLRGYHWNIKGSRFFVLHSKFEDMYNDVNTKIDEIAERILTLGGAPLHSFAKYIETASLPVREDVSCSNACLKAIQEDVLYLLNVEREIMNAAAEVNDSGTQDMLSGYISGQEKLLWMLNAYMSK